MCVCVCERERERERETLSIHVYFIYLQLNIFNILYMEQHVMVQSQGRFSMSSAEQT